MSARGIYNYNTNEKLKNVIDNIALNIANQIEMEYQARGNTTLLIDFLKFFLIHGTCIIIKTLQNSQPIYTLIHPEMDDVKVNLEPIPRLTFTRYYSLSQKEEKLVIGENNFRIYEGAFANIDLLDLLKFLNYEFL